MSTRGDFEFLAGAVVAALQELRGRIDALGEIGTTLAGTDKVDMLACFASNSLYGTQALIEQIRFVVAHPKAKRARWP